MSHFILSGFFSELGVFFTKNKWAMVLYGFNSYGSKNWVRGESIDATISVPIYMELRVFFNEKSSFSPFVSFGLGMNTIKFENTKGAEAHLLLTAGLGTHLLVGKNFLLQAMVRPYLMVNNELGQSFAFETQFGIGYCWRKK